MWEIISVEQTARFIRVPQSEIEDFWYVVAVGLIEEFTGWTLTAEDNITDIVDGTGSNYIEVSKYPLSSVSTVTSMGVLFPPDIYILRWNMIQLITYLGDTPTRYGLYNGLYHVDGFPTGTANVQVTYNCAGYLGLPSKYFQATVMTLLMLIKEISTNWRGEGSDQILRKYRPDRTQNPEEVLINYGQHGKMKGIMKAFLPPRRNFT